MKTPPTAGPIQRNKPHLGQNMHYLQLTLVVLNETPECSYKLWTPLWLQVYLVGYILISIYIYSVDTYAASQNSSELYPPTLTIEHSGTN